MKLNEKKNIWNRIKILIFEIELNLLKKFH